MTLHQRASRVLAALKRRYPSLDMHLAAESAWELLVATVLAAQCTDARVNTVTPELFRRWPGPADLAEASPEDLEEVIRSTGFYHSKAKHLIAAARRVRDVYDGETPRTMADLVTLPGVARKTANVVLWGGYGINEGLAVDTHVKRIAFRLGLTTHTDPVDVERDLMELFPRGVGRRQSSHGVVRQTCMHGQKAALRRVRDGRLLPGLHGGHGALSVRLPPNVGQSREKRQRLTWRFAPCIVR